MATPPSSRRALAAFQDLNTCNVSDALDSLGARGQVAGILPLWRGCPKIAGQVMPMKLSLQATYSTVVGTLEAIEAANPGDILVIDNGGRGDSNSFGGIAAFSASHRGLRGCVIDGGTRDVDEMDALHFPVYGKGTINTSVRGRIGFEGYGLPMELGGVTVRPGDYLFADVNGIVVVSAEVVTDALSRAGRLAEMERRIKRDIAAGTRPVTAHRRHRYEEAARRPSG